MPGPEYDAINELFHTETRAIDMRAYFAAHAPDMPGWFNNPIRRYMDVLLSHDLFNLLSDTDKDLIIRCGSTIFSRCLLHHARRS